MGSWSFRQKSALIRMKGSSHREAEACKGLVALFAAFRGGEGALGLTCTLFLPSNSLVSPEPTPFCSNNAHSPCLKNPRCHLPQGRIFIDTLFSLRLLTNRNAYQEFINLLSKTPHRKQYNFFTGRFVPLLRKKISLQWNIGS